MEFILDNVSSDIRIHYTGFQALEEEFEKPYFRRLSEIIEAERSKFAVYPSVEEVWSWTTRAPIQDTRVVILGKAGVHRGHQSRHPR
jgi:uracil-DNA glycosylase